MKISKQARRDAKELFRAIQVNGVLDEARARLAVDEVLRLKPRGYVGILSHFQRLLKLDIDRRSARIESVVPLDDAEQNGVRSALTKRYGTGLNFTFAQNPALIGGMRIKVGSDVFDGSIQSRLAQLEEV
ncbi:MAG TPA: F0F1 ATP synthase subunit delta [Methylomirabilota bacterium]|nr:F0F1 ATP synthase subunit delta [Methylomirabilota bacterium]